MAINNTPNVVNAGEWLYDYLRNTEGCEFVEVDENHNILAQIKGEAIIALPVYWHFMCVALDMTLNEFKIEYSKRERHVSPAAFALYDLKGHRSTRIHLDNHDHSKWEIKNALRSC